VRPELLDLDAQNTFPSGHMAVFAVLVAALLWAVPRTARAVLAVLGAGLLGVVSWQLLEFGWHRPSDLLGAQALVHAVVPRMVERRRGDVVFVTSEVAEDPRTHMAAYVASKAGLEGYARAMAMECEGTGVRVGIVRPGPSNTEQGTGWSEDSINEVVASWFKWGLLRHDGAIRPAEFADAVLAVVSAPKGTRYALLEVQPEAPLSHDAVLRPSAD